MTQRYASKTTVSSDRSKAEIEGILRRYGADQFMQGWEAGLGVVGFRINGFQVRMLLPLPNPGGLPALREEGRLFHPLGGTGARGRAEGLRAGGAAGMAGPAAGDQGEAGGGRGRHYEHRAGVPAQHGAARQPPPSGRTCCPGSGRLSPAATCRRCFQRPIP